MTNLNLSTQIDPQELFPRDLDTLGQRMNKYKRIAIFLTLAIAFFFILTQGIQAAFDGILAKKDAIANMQDRLEKLTTKENLLKSQNRAILISQSQRLNEAIPPLINLPLILATLQKLAEELEIELGEFSISSDASVISLIPVEQAEKLSAFQFNVKLVGDFEKIHRFIERLGSVSPMLRIESIAFAQDSSKSVLNFYFQPKIASASPDLATPLGVMTQDHNQALQGVLVLEPPALGELGPATPSASRESPFQ